MKNLRNCTLCLIFLSAITGIYAQNPAESLASKQPMTPSVIVTSKSPKATDDIEEARRRFRTLFNLYRDYSVSVDTITLNDVESQNGNSAEEAETPQFTAYLDKMSNILSRKVDKITSNSNEARAERSHYLGGLNTLRSAKCFQKNSQSSTFTRSRDMDNNAIMAFDLDALKTSTRYGLVENYKEGFSRIRKDQVYGYLNLCGDEVITCQ